MNMQWTDPAVPGTDRSLLLLPERRRRRRAMGEVTARAGVVRASFTPHPVPGRWVLRIGDAVLTVVVDQAVGAVEIITDRGGLSVVARADNRVLVQPRVR